ncbi:hypothetical protein GCM10017750_11460 [Streptomyces racemochromogenes]
MADSLAANRASAVAKGRWASILLPHAELAHTSWSSAVAALSSKALNRVRPGVGLEVTVGLRGLLLLDGLRIANALHNTASTLC